MSEPLDNQNAFTLGPAHTNCLFPTQFSLYSRSAGTFIGEHMNQPLFAVTWDNDHKNRATSSPTVTLHSADSVKSEALATSLDENWERERWIVMLPSKPELMTLDSEVVVRKIQGKKFAYTFSMETGGGKTGRMEHFQWQTASSTPALQRLGGSHLGWELSRLTGENHSSQFNRDGHEVLAVCAEPGLGYFRKRWKTMFLGAGRDSTLGRQWEIMVVITSLALHDWNWKQLRKIHRGGAAGV